MIPPKKIIFFKGFIMQWRKNIKYQIELRCDKKSWVAIIVASATPSYNICYLVSYMCVKRLTQNQNKLKKLLVAWLCCPNRLFCRCIFATSSYWTLLNVTLMKNAPFFDRPFFGNERSKCALLNKLDASFTF